MPGLQNREGRGNQRFRLMISCQHITVSSHRPQKPLLWASGTPGPVSTFPTRRSERAPSWKGWRGPRHSSEEAAEEAVPRGARADRSTSSRTEPAARPGSPDVQMGARPPVPCLGPPHHFCPCPRADPWRVTAKSRLSAYIVSWVPQTCPIVSVT